MVVYLVTKGVYSNMRPIAVFTNKTLAYLKSLPQPELNDKWRTNELD